MKSGKAPTSGGAIAALAFAAFVSSANLRVCDPLLPQVAAELAVSIGTAAWIVTAFAVAYGVFQVVVGPLADARGKLPMVVFGSIWAGVATLLCAVMPRLTPLVLLRFLAGAGCAAIIPLAIAWLGDVIAYDKRQAILARFASGQILGIVFGQAAGGVLGEFVGWRGTMVVLGIAHLAAGLLLATHISRLQVERSERGGGWTASARTAGAIVARSWARVVLAGAFLEGATMFGAFAYVGADLHERFGIGLGLIGTTIAVFGAGALCYALSAGVLLRQLAQARLLALSSALLATGYLILAFMSHFWLAAPAVALLGMGFYMLHNNLQTEATQMAPEARGLSVSLFAIMLFTGQSAGVALAGVVVDRWGAKPVFLTAAVGLALIALWFRRRLLAHHRSLHSLG